MERRWPGCPSTSVCAVPDGVPPVSGPRILLATGNSDKQRMLAGLLEGLPVQALAPADLGVIADPDESGDTHEAIARAKAEEWSRVAGMPAIASDGGLLVPALGANWESRHTHRFAGPAADDAERQRRLIDMLEPFSGDDRRAAFVEALAIADEGKTVASWEVSGATGRIVDSLPCCGGDTDGDGFWVFPLWYFAEFDRTYDHLTEAERATLCDHWLRLRTHVQEFLPGWFGSLAALPNRLQ